MLQLTQYIKSDTFPCIMAKAVQKVGLFKIVKLNNNISAEDNAQKIMQELKPFLALYREKPNRLSSFVVSFKGSKLSFKDFEEYFWELLVALRRLDEMRFDYDKRVSSNPYDSNYSFSLQGEAFFIIMLHPDSPRFARRTTTSIVFNLHQQFEKLRNSGAYKRIRDLIRKRDVSLQGNINPTLEDFGEASEILQYSGSQYHSVEEIVNSVKGKLTDEEN